MNQQCGPWSPGAGQRRAGAVREDGPSRWAILELRGLGRAEGAPRPFSSASLAQLSGQQQTPGELETCSSREAFAFHFKEIEVKSVHENSYG